MGDEPRYGGAYVPREVTYDDPKPALDAKCEANCGKYKKLLDACEKRIEEKGAGDCAAWFGDYVHCVDECVSKQLFKQLK